MLDTPGKTPETRPVGPDNYLDVRALDQGDVLCLSFADGVNLNLIQSGRRLSYGSFGMPLKVNLAFKELDAPESAGTIGINGAFVNGSQFLTLDQIAIGAPVDFTLGGPNEVVSSPVSQISVSPASGAGNLSIHDYYASKEVVTNIDHQRALQTAEIILQKTGITDSIKDFGLYGQRDWTSQDKHLNIHTKFGMAMGNSIVVWDEVSGDYFFMGYWNYNDEDLFEVGYAQATRKELQPHLIVPGAYFDPSLINVGKIRNFNRYTSPVMKLDLNTFNPGKQDISQIGLPALVTKSPICILMEKIFS